MKLRAEYKGDHVEVKYLLDVGDDRLVEASMNIRTAEEIVQGAESRYLSDIEDYGLLVNERWYFPMKAFEFEEEEKPTPRPQKKQAAEKKSSRKKPYGKPAADQGKIGA